MSAGRNFNVIADTCTIKGTVRTFREHTRDLAERRVREIAAQTAALFGAEITVDYKGGFSSVVNDEHEAERCRRVALEQFGKDRVQKLRPIMAGEDFAFYLEKTPGCFIFVGAGNTQLNCNYDHHHPKFDIDEAAFPTAAKLFIALTFDYLNSH
jgi:amidohydrolase